MARLALFLAALLGGSGAEAEIAFTRATAAELGKVRDRQRREPGAELRRGRQRSLLVVRLGEKRTGGYAIEIISVSFSTDTLTVRARVRQPDRGAMVTQALTYPVDAVWINTRRLPPPNRLKFRLLDESGAELTGR